MEWMGRDSEGFFLKQQKRKEKKITINSHPIYRFYHKSTSVYVLGLELY